MHLNSSQGAREDAFSHITTPIDCQLKVNLLLRDTVASYLLQVLAPISITDIISWAEGKLAKYDVSASASPGFSLMDLFPIS